MKMHHCTLRIPSKIKKVIDELAKDRNHSFSDQCRELIEHGIEKQGHLSKKFYELNTAMISVSYSFSDLEKKIKESIQNSKKDRSNIEFLIGKKSSSITNRLDSYESEIEKLENIFSDINKKISEKIESLDYYHDKNITDEINKLNLLKKNFDDVLSQFNTGVKSQINNSEKLKVSFDDVVKKFKFEVDNEIDNLKKNSKKYYKRSLFLVLILALVVGIIIAKEASEKLYFNNYRHDKIVDLEYELATKKELFDQVIFFKKHNIFVDQEKKILYMPKKSIVKIQRN